MIYKLLLFIVKYVFVNEVILFKNELIKLRKVIVMIYLFCLKVFPFPYFKIVEINST